MKKQLVCICAIAGLAFALPAAENNDSQPFSMTLDAGISFMDDPDVGGAPLEMDTGFGLALGGACNLNEMFAVGIETGFRYNEVKDATDGECLWQVPILATVSLRYENDSKFVPYVSLGIGGALGVAADDYESASDFVFAWQAEVGVRYKISECVAAGVCYKYLALADQDYDFGGGANVSIDDVSSHMIAASISWSF